MGVQINITDPAQLEAVRAREASLCTDRIRMMLSAGANVVLTTMGIDDLALKPFVEAGALAVRRCKKEDLIRIAKATGATLLSSFASLEGGEAFDASALGSAEEVIQERFGDNECILITGTKAYAAASVVLRGANSMMLEEMERSLHDALCVVKRTLESGRVVPGGGACEAAVAVFLDSFAMSIASREQAAIVAFSEALLTLPKTLAANCGSGDPMDLVAQLRAAHYSAINSETSSFIKTVDGRSSSAKSTGGLKNTGLDLETGTLRDSVAAGVLEPMLSKIRMLKSATEAAISILRIDDMMTITPPPSNDQDGHDQCQ
jgi:T-complex protein 1 subunit alpha